MVWKPFYDMKLLESIFRLAKAIPVGTSGPRDVIASILAARRELEAGHMVCIFAEGFHQPHWKSFAVQTRTGKNCRWDWTCP